MAGDEELRCVISDLMDQVRDRDAELATLRAKVAELEGALREMNAIAIEARSFIGYVPDYDDPQRRADWVSSKFQELSSAAKEVMRILGPIDAARASAAARE